MKKTNLVQNAINNNIVVQKTVIENDLKLNNILKFLYINGGVSTRSVFTFSTSEEDKLYKQDLEYYLTTLKVLNLIEEKTILKHKIILLTNRAIQILEGKDDLSNISYIITIKKLNKYNGVKLDNLINKNKNLARILKNINLINPNSEDFNEDINKQLILNNIIYVNDNITPIDYKSDTFPCRKTFNSPRNSTGKKLINSNIFKLDENNFYVYIDTVFNDERALNTLTTVITFFKSNFGTKLNIYLNILPSALFQKLDDYADIGCKDIKLYTLTKQIINLYKNTDEVKEYIVKDTEAYNYYDIEFSDYEEEIIIEDPFIYDDIIIEFEDIVEDTNKLKLEENIQLAYKYLAAIHEDLISRGFKTKINVKPPSSLYDMFYAIEVDFPYTYYAPSRITVCTEVPADKHNLFHIYNIDIQSSDTVDIIKNKVLDAYREMLEDMEKKTTEKISPFGKNKNKYKYKELVL